MKKNIIYGMILLAAVACNKENMGNNLVPQPGEGETAVRLTGEIALPATKVEFDDTYGQFTWSSANDKIALHVTEGKRGDKVMIPACYTTASVVPNDPASTCDFFFVLSEGQTRDYYAVYPADIADAGNYGNPDLKVNLPSEYEIGPQGMENWSPTPMVAVNDPSSQTLTFRHIGGLLRLMLNDVSPATASFEVSLGKRITGSFTVNDPATSVPYIVTDDNADVVTFTLSEPPSEYTDGFILNLPVPTGSYEMLSVKAKNENGDVIFSYNDEDVRSFFSGRGRHCETVVSTVSIPLCFEAQEDGAVTIDNPLGLTIEYSHDNKNWTPASDAMIYISFDAGDCVYLRGNNLSYSGLDMSSDNPMESPRTKINCDGACYLYGNVMSLIDAENFPNLTEITKEAAFAFLFSGASDIFNHPEKTLELPATTLSTGCYAFMFQNCTGLVTAPEIPAEVLPEYCCILMYDGCKSLVTPPAMHLTKEVGKAACGLMFENCISLVKTPELAATTIAKECYQWMFAGCAALEDVPEILPATTLGEDCYNMMFYGCSSIERAPQLPATVMAPSCYQSMFEECSSLTAAPELPATTLADRCYYSMFAQCPLLTTAPEILPATTLAKECYSHMFAECSSLTKAPVLPDADRSGMTGCYSNMFNKCTSLNYVKAMFLTFPSDAWSWLSEVSSEGTFVMNAAATWDPASYRGTSGIPNGWTVETATE